MSVVSGPGWSPRAISDATGVAHQTVWRILQRFGLSRRPRAANEPVKRYEWPCPGDLLHMDVCEYARFAGPVRSFVYVWR